MKKILVLDNYDSFTYNLVHYVESVFDGEIVVKRNNKISLDEVKGFDAVVLSPGPGLPKDAGIMPELIAHYHSSIPILGICLGHQCIAEYFGAKIYNLPVVYHGVATPVKLKNTNGIFQGMNETIEAGRYHSWAVEENSVPEELEVLATDNQGIIMAIQHKRFPITGIQFHPESILTPEGKQIIKNWLLTLV